MAFSQTTPRKLNLNFDFKFDLTMFKERDGAYRHLSLSNSPHSSLDSSTHHHRTNSDTVPTISKSGRIFKGLYLSFQVTLHTKMTMLIHNGILKSRAQDPDPDSLDPQDLAFWIQGVKYQPKTAKKIFFTPKPQI